MHIHVLGSAAGGGFPQWNCNCLNCRSVRDGSRPARARTQASLAVSHDGERWLLVNASPDIRTQLQSFAPLNPRGTTPRNTPLGAVMLTNADVDHVGGLLSLREFQPLMLYATPQVRGWVVERNCMFNVLRAVPQQAEWTDITLHRPMPVVYEGGEDAGLRYEALAVPCKPPGWLGQRATSGADTVALKLTDTASGASMVYLPGVKSVGPEVRDFIAGTDALFFDGTFWADDELPRMGLANKTALALGHLPMGGPGGSIETLRPLLVPRRIFTHINNTNPVLLEDSPEHHEVTRAGWVLAFDGMHLQL